jgi:HEAT repeat protein
VNRSEGRSKGVAERLRAVVIAGHQGDHDTAKAHLDDPEPSIRAAALSAIARTGQCTAEEFRRALTDPNTAVRHRAVELAATGILPTDQVDLLSLLSDPDDRIVEVTAWALGEQDPPNLHAVVPLCEIATGHADSLCREAAVASLGAIGDPSALPTILAATTDIATVRRRAIIALAPFDGPEVDSALERATSDRDWQVRQAAEDLLASTTDDD